MNYVEATNDTNDYELYLTDEKRDRLRRMARALQNDLTRQDGIGPEMRAEALKRAERWLNESSIKATQKGGI